MATFNGAKYLQAQLDSIIEQDLPPDELVVSDDNSTDETLEILKKFQSKAKISVVITEGNQQLGYSQNFGKALSKTTGDLIFLSDQDDVWKKRKISETVKFAENHPAALVFLNDAELADINLSSTGLSKLGQLKAAGIDRSHFVMGCCAAVRRELLEYCLPIPADFKGHDNWLVEFSNGVSATVISEEILQYYRRHGKNTSELRVNQLKKVQRKAVFLESILKAIKSKGDISELIQRKDRLEMFLRRVGEKKELALENNRDLLRFEEKIKEELNFIELRISLRTRWLVERVALILKKDSRFLYFSNGSLKQMVRDIWA